ncbi:lipopolysaccharide heptosyltransferase I [Sulfurimonas marina]|uniref:Lipopolysaccharide heptosyltransferase 1 n=1 Tax=Sulfurimonas marina TaxID=2590551 RepID=A0A7M1AZ89_9BACT|nr:lipopolysaccharide heptosyltransferase I [Sulfurimonas marina]QOP41868.1 lipopolysaccharide heptosyltransferase I [Sulfurimonas marina]
MKQEIKKIAIVRLSALGDIVNSAVVLQFIKQFYPDVEIDWITEEVFAPILKNNPEINMVHTVNIKEIKKEKSFSKLKALISKLRSLPEYDLVIDMQGLIKSAVVARIVSKKTHGFNKYSTRESLASLFYKTTSDIPYEHNVVKRNCFVVADALDFSITDTMLLEKKAVFPITSDYTLMKDKKNIAFVIGASWPSKIYPKELVAKVCDSLQEQVYIIWGNEQEKSEAEWICEHTEHATLAPKMQLDELISFISNVDLLIGNDTGPTHIAWAQNIPSITLLGPTTKRMIYETPKNIGIKSSSEVDILKINKDDFSIKDIPYEDIVQTAKDLLCKS